MGGGNEKGGKEERRREREREVVVREVMFSKSKLLVVFTLATAKDLGVHLSKSSGI